MRSRSEMLLTADMALIKELVSALPNSEVCVADLGAGVGMTALTVLENRLPESVMVTTIDNNPDALAGVRGAVQKVGRLSDWSGIQGDSVEIGKISGIKFDLLLLDTSHTYEATRDELAAWLPRLNPGAYIWAHDYICLGDAPSPEMGQPPCLRGEACGWCGDHGVSKAINELMESGVLETYKVAGLSWSGRLCGLL